MLALEAASYGHPQLLQADLKALDPGGWREKYLLFRQRGAGFFQPEELRLLQSSQRGLLEGKGKTRAEIPSLILAKRSIPFPHRQRPRGAADPGRERQRGQCCWRQNFQLGNTWKRGKQEQGEGAFPSPSALAAEGVSKGKGSFQVYGRDEPGSCEGTPGEGSATGKKCGNSSRGWAHSEDEQDLPRGRQKRNELNTPEKWGLEGISGSGSVISGSKKSQYFWAKPRAQFCCFLDFEA